MKRLLEQIKLLLLFFVTLAVLSATSLVCGDDGRVQLDWNDNTEPDLSYYNVYRSTTAGDPSPTRINAAPVTTSTYIDTNLTYNTVYYYVVTAVDDSGNESDFSVEASATPVDTTDPTDPSNLSLLVISQTQVNLTWTGSTDNVAVTGYRVYRDEALVSTETGTSYEDTGLTDGTTYSYKVSAVDAAGNESELTAAVSATASDLIVHWTFDEGSGATAADSSQHAQDATLLNGTLWVDGRESGALGLDGTDDRVNCGNNAYLGQLSEDFTLSVWVRNLGSGTQYILDKSDLSTGLFLRTNPDNTIQFTLTDGTLQCSALTDGATAAGSDWRHLALTVDGRSTMSLYVDGLLQTTFQDDPLSSVGSVGNSSDLILGTNASLQDFFTGEIDDLRIYNRILPQSEIAALFEPNPPSGLDAAAGDEEVTLDWNDNVESNLADYDVYRSETQGGPYTRVNSTSVTASTYTDTAGLTNGTTYYYVVRAIDDNMQESENSSEVAATPNDATPPAVPSGLAPTDGEEQISLDWSDNTESDLQGYIVYRSTTSGGPYTRVNTTTLTVSTYIDTGLSNGTTYYYALSAVDTTSNESTKSGEVSGTPADTTAPSAPVAIGAIAGENQVTISWTANSEPDLDYYNLYRSTSASGPFTTKLNATPIRTLTYVDDTALNGTTYYYSLKAVDTAGNESAVSAASDPTMPADTTAPATPTGFVATPL